MVNKSIIIQYSAGIFGISFLILGATIKFAIFPSLLKSQIIENIKLVPGSTAYDAFIKSPLPVYMKFHFFQIENPDNVTAGGKPKIKELGPYAFREEQEKIDLFEPSPDLISFNKFTRYIFDAEKSKELGCKGPVDGKSCSAKDKIRVLNVVLNVIGQLLNVVPDSAIKKTIVSIINKNDALFNEATVENVLYNGFSNGILQLIQNIPELYKRYGVKFLGAKFEEIENLYNFILPGQIKGGKFAFFKGKNASKILNYYTVNNGLANIENVLNTEQLNGMSKLPTSWWPTVAMSPDGQKSGLGGHCRVISGGDGTRFPPNLQKDKIISLFVSDLCRSVRVKFAEEVEVEGITTYRFRLDPDIFTFIGNPKNYCYCPTFHQCAKIVVPENKTTEEWDLSDCDKNSCNDGILDVSSCYGAPIVMSQPHFYNAPESLQKSIDGLNPNQEKHDTILDVEPNLGATLSAKKRLQVNFHAKKVKEINLLKKINDILIPIMWVEEGATLDENKAGELKGQIFTPQLLVDIFSIGGMVLGPLLIMLAMFLSLKRH